MADPRTPGPVGLSPTPARKTTATGPTKVPVKAPKPGPIGVGAKKSAPPAAPGGANVDAQIVAFAESKSGQRVGDGECFALAEQALKKAGAKSAADFGTVTKDGDYKWGAQVALADVKPGDIVQFRDYEFTRAEEKEDGSGSDWTEGRRHHTAIVKSVDGNGLLTVLEQNSPKGSPVRRVQLAFSNTSLRRGEATITITVKGSVWFYRPQTP
jgi:hypothetical protein